MNNPENVPPIRDARFIHWDELAATFGQLAKLEILLREEGISPAELYGDGFTELRELSRWSVSWGISYLQAAQDARYTNAARDRLEREQAELDEQRVKSMMAHILRTQRYA